MSPQQTSGYGQPWMASAPATPAAAAAPHISGSSYSYLSAQPQQPAYTPAQQQVQNNPGYISQFDPYASIAQGWDPAASSSSSSQSQPTTSPSPSGVSHPREYIRIHKAEIEAWDTYAWKQLIGAFDAVKDAWAAKKTEIEQKIQQFTMQMQYGGGGYHPMQIQQEIARLQGVSFCFCCAVVKLVHTPPPVTAYEGRRCEFWYLVSICSPIRPRLNVCVDSAAAASFQMHEVFENYRKSGDLASKRRVREASNATLTGCPDWPPAIY